MSNDKLKKQRRWSAKRKLEIVTRLFRGESIEEVSRDVGVEIHRLDDWKREALASMEDGFKVRVNDPVEQELERAKRRIGELSMENELLKERVRKQGPLALRRSK